MGVVSNRLIANVCQLSIAMYLSAANDPGLFLSVFTLSLDRIPSPDLQFTTMSMIS